MTSFNLKACITVLFAGLLCVSFSASAVTVTGQEKKVIYQNLAKGKSALLKGEYITTVNMVPPRAFTVLRITKEAMLESLKSLMNNIKEKGWRITRLDYGKIHGVYQCRNTKIVLVPAYSEMERFDARIFSKNYMVVSKSRGDSKWYFADGAGFKKRELFDAIYGCKGIPITFPESNNKTIRKPGYR